MASLDRQKHHRHSIRLPGHHYCGTAAYFVTIVTQGRLCLFGDVVNGEMRLSDFGKIADEFWCAIPAHFPTVKLGAHVIMPNHVHGIILIEEDEPCNSVGAQHCCAPTPDGPDRTHKINVKPGSLGAMIRSFKSAVSYRINQDYGITDIWQRNYYEHILRDERDMDIKSNYIASNPCNWSDDVENPIKAHLAATP